MPSYSSTVPRLSAVAAACVRSRTFKRLSRQLTCHFTVPSVIAKVSPICQLLRPFTINYRVSGSRALRLVLAGRSPSERSAGGGNTLSPAFTLRIELTSSSPGMPLSE